MKLNDNFVTYDADGEYYMVAASGFTGMVRCNKTAFEILEELKKGGTAESIARSLTGRYAVGEEQALKDTQGVIRRLESIGAIDYD